MGKKKKEGMKETKNIIQFGPFRYGISCGVELSIRKDKPGGNKLTCKKTEGQHCFTSYKAGPFDGWGPLGKTSERTR